ncbi:CDP-4-dehydro-6-deoxyglucose reductase [Candidatus Kryptobacter tengchongensis]|nr:CDP-4-dehydro-6-deoxyglucose reductase [Candidatus Kryptobacter tengchongensis]
MNNGRSFKIHLLPNDITFLCYEKQTILESALKAGIELPHGCTKGGCGVCKIRVKGRVDFGRVSKVMLTDQEKENGFCLSCRAIPLEDIEISLIDGSHAKVVRYDEFYSFLFKTRTNL